MALAAFLHKWLLYYAHTIAHSTRTRSKPRRCVLAGHCWEPSTGKGKVSVLLCADLRTMADGGGEDAGRGGADAAGNGAGSI